MMRISVCFNSLAETLLLTNRIAHKDAFLICSILHRDISAGNILLSFEGDGILIDWEMARKVKDIHEGPRQPGRTVSAIANRHRDLTILTSFFHNQGTWLFMSIKLLTYPTTRHELQDDLESFCYVVIYLALRYLPHNKVSELPAIMTNVFEHHYNVPTGVFGGTGKESMVNSRRYIGKDLDFTDNEPLTSWIDMALRFIADWYAYLNQSVQYISAEIPHLELRNRPLRDHKTLDQTFQTALEKIWPQNDKAMDHLPPKGKAFYKKHKLEGADEGSVSKRSKSSTSHVTPGPSNPPLQVSGQRSRRPGLRSRSKLKVTQR
jgi:serine/threonine protein kinase